MEAIQVIILSVVQGLTEYLPVSSSGHLIILPQIFGWQDQGLVFDVMVHVGTATAALVYFRKDIIDLLISFKTDERIKKFVSYFIIALFPAIIFGLTFKGLIEFRLRSVHFVAFNLILWGVILIIADFKSKQNHVKKTELENLTFRETLLIGVMQALALFPGTSRSGITISTGVLQNIEHKTAVKLSFLMGIPLIFAAGFLSVIDYLRFPADTFVSGPQILLALLFSFASGMFAIHVMMKFLEKIGLTFFGVYRITLAVILLAYF